MKTKILIKKGDRKEFVSADELTITYRGEEITLLDAFQKENVYEETLKNLCDEIAKKYAIVSEELNSLEKTNTIQAEINKKLVAMIKEIKETQDSDLVL